MDTIASTTAFRTSALGELNASTRPGMRSGVHRISVSGSIRPMTPTRQRTGAAPPPPTCGDSARIAAVGGKASTTPSSASPALRLTSDDPALAPTPPASPATSASRMRGSAMAACGANASGAHCAKSLSVNSACVLTSHSASSDASASKDTANTCPACSAPRLAPARSARRTAASARGRALGPAEATAPRASASANEAASVGGGARVSVG
mmetsp:Transcript_8077/g.22461  ORF Transcript_8077/g.22461 Transcript_8077/m.22461 type:complete len:210 (-) Transcript_8077:365-994(-)